MAEHNYNLEKNNVADAKNSARQVEDTYQCEQERLTVQILSGGHIMFKGTRAGIEEFLRVCMREGLELRVEYLSLYERQDIAIQP